MKTLRLKVEPRKVVELAPKGAQAISWYLLGQKADCISETEYGDQKSNNLGLRILEDALDWSIGVRVSQFILACVKNFKKMPRPFTLEIKGDQFEAVFPSGRRYSL